MTCGLYFWKNQGLHLIRFALWHQQHLCVIGLWAEGIAWVVDCGLQCLADWVMLGIGKRRVGLSASEGHHSITQRLNLVSLAETWERTTAGTQMEMTFPGASPQTPKCGRLSAPAFLGVALRLLKQKVNKTEGTSSIWLWLWHGFVVPTNFCFVRFCHTFFFFFL